VVERVTSLVDSFKIADDVLKQGVQGIADLITIPGLVNLDFADVKTVMANSGSAMMGIGRASGENRAVEAAEKAISSPLLEETINGATGVLLNVSGGESLTLHEVNDVADIIYSAVDPEANILFGSVIDEALGDEIMVTVIATGFNNHVDLTPGLNEQQLDNNSQEELDRPMIKMEDSAYQKINKEAVEVKGAPLSQFSGQHKSNESEVSMNISALNQDPYRSIDPINTSYENQPLHSPSIQSVGSKLSMDEMDDDQIPPFLKNF
jgi:cell division GTPase FtsZ